MAVLRFICLHNDFAKKTQRKSWLQEIYCKILKMCMVSMKTEHIGFCFVTTTNNATAQTASLGIWFPVVESGRRGLIRCELNADDVKHSEILLFR